jgi:hypothetical protein
MLKNCPNTSLELKKLLLDQLAERRKARGTQRSTRSYTKTGTNAKPFPSTAQVSTQKHASKAAHVLSVTDGRVNL